MVWSSSNSESRGPVSGLAKPVSIEDKRIDPEVRKRLEAFFKSCPSREEKVSVEVAAVASAEDLPDEDALEEELVSASKEEAMEEEEDLEELSSDEEEDLEEDEDKPESRRRSCLRSSK